eukprot:SM000029S10437  [mRNA]  locus=s29:135389:140147:+ [translate_table: standard]
MAIKRRKRKCTSSIIRKAAVKDAQQTTGGQSPPIGAGEVLDPSPPGHSGKRGWRATTPASLPFVASPNAVKVVRQARSQCRSRRRLKVLMDLYKPPPPPDQPIDDACSAEASGQCERCRPWSGKRRCCTLPDALRNSSSVGSQSPPASSVAKVVPPAPSFPHGGCRPRRVQPDGNSPHIDKTAPNAPELLCSLPLTCKQSHLDKDADSIAQVGGEDVKLPITLPQEIKEDSVELGKAQLDVAAADAQKAEGKQASKQGEEVNLLCLEDGFLAETEPKPVIEKVLYTESDAEANCTNPADRNTSGTTDERRQPDEEAVLHALQSVNKLIAEAQRKLLDVFDFSDTETMSPVRLRTSNGRARLQAWRQDTQAAGVLENQLSRGQRMLKLAQEAASTLDKAFETSQSSREVMEQGDPERSDRRESDPIPLQHEAEITDHSWSLTNIGIGGHWKPQHEGVRENDTPTTASEDQLTQSSNIDLDLGAGSNPEGNVMEDSNITGSLASQVAPATLPLPGSSPLTSACHQARHVSQQDPALLLHPQPFQCAQSPSPPASPAHTGICVTLPPRSPSPRNRRQQKQTPPKSVKGILKTSQSCQGYCKNHAKMSERSMDHSKHQLMLADKANTILKEELHHLREAVQIWALPLLTEANAYKRVSTLLSRSKLQEATAQRYLSKIARSSDHFCRLVSQKQPRTPKKLRFADDAGLELCQIHTIGEHVQFDLKKPPDICS